MRRKNWALRTLLLAPGRQSRTAAPQEQIRSWNRGLVMPSPPYDNATGLWTTFLLSASRAEALIGRGRIFGVPSERAGSRCGFWQWLPERSENRCEFLQWLPDQLLITFGGALGKEHCASRTLQCARRML